MNKGIERIGKNTDRYAGETIDYVAVLADSVR